MGVKQHSGKNSETISDLNLITIYPFYMYVVHWSEEQTLHVYCAFERIIPAFVFLDLSAPTTGTSATTRLLDYDPLRRSLHPV